MESSQSVVVKVKDFRSCRRQSLRSRGRGLSQSSSEPFAVVDVKGRGKCRLGIERKGEKGEGEGRGCREGRRKRRYVAGRNCGGRKEKKGWLGGGRVRREEKKENKIQGEGYRESFAVVLVIVVIAIVLVVVIVVVGRAGVIGSISRPMSLRSRIA